VLTGIAALITAISGLIVAATSAVGMVVVARRTSPRERDEAARTATQQALSPGSQVEAEAAALIEIANVKRGRRIRRDRRAHR